MTKTIDEIWAEYEAHQATIKAEYEARKARREAAWAEHIATLHTTGNQPPTVIGGWYSAEDYARDYAAGRSTE